MIIITSYRIVPIIILFGTLNFYIHLYLILNKLNSTNVTFGSNNVICDGS